MICLEQHHTHLLLHWSWYTNQSDTTNERNWHFVYQPQRSLVEILHLDYTLGLSKVRQAKEIRHKLFMHKILPYKHFKMTNTCMEKHIYIFLVSLT